MQQKKMFLIFLDAFSSNFIDPDNTPFLFSLAKMNRVRKITHLPAYDGIGASIFSSTWPEDNNVWTNYIRTKSKKKDSLLYRLGLFISDIIPNDRLAWDIRYFFIRLLKMKIPTPNLIPKKFVPYFESKLSKSFFEENAIENFPTIFDILRKNNIDFKVINTPILRGDEFVINKTIKYIQEKNISHLTYLKLGSLDTLGHIYGPDSNIIRERINYFDKSLNQIINLAIKSDKNIHFIIFSDHGMVPVTKRINIIEKLKNFSLILEKDIIFFIDSTMARFWITNENTKKRLVEFLKTIEGGHLLTDAELKKGKLPIKKEEYGDVIFALYEGYVFSPDFFHRYTKMKGMHGYYSSKYDSPIFIYHSMDSKIKIMDTIEFIDIMPTVLCHFDIDIPKSSKGKIIITN